MQNSVVGDEKIYYSTFVAPLSFISKLEEINICTLSEKKKN